MPAAFAVHQGYESTFVFRFADHDSSEWYAVIDFGDGSAPVSLTPSNAEPVELSHTYFGDGPFTVSVRVTDDGAKTGFANAPVRVFPRRLVFIQGLSSRSECPDGRYFSTRAPSWIAEHLLQLSASEVPVPLSERDFRYVSYSGEFCGGGDGGDGGFARYAATDTCGGIDDPGGAADRLRAAIEAAAPSKVTVLGHSMGGLAAAYLIGTDPEWAKQRIASVITFDSPLGGVPQVNLSILRVIGDCSFNSASHQDLSDSNDALLAVAAPVARQIPFYNLNATKKEGPTGCARSCPAGVQASTAKNCCGTSMLITMICGRPEPRGQPMPKPSVR